MPLPMTGRVCVVTGVSRRRGIGFAVSARLAEMGASLAVHHHVQHDGREYGVSEDPEELIGQLQTLMAPNATLIHLAADLADPCAPELLIEQAGTHLGHLDALVCNHAHGGDAVALANVTAEALDRHWGVNTRATLLLSKAFAAQHDGRPGGRIIWMTSGQERGPMGDNLAYATSKAALSGVTWSVADDLARRGILLNTVNPGPVNTGYLDGAPDEFVQRFPAGRIGEPNDPARLIAWLISDDGCWVVGQTLHSEGGFRR